MDEQLAVLTKGRKPKGAAKGGGGGVEEKEEIGGSSVGIVATRKSDRTRRQSTKQIESK